MIIFYDRNLMAFLFKIAHSDFETTLFTRNGIGNQNLKRILK